MTPIRKKMVCETRFLGPGIRLPIRKVPHTRQHPSRPEIRSLLVNWVCWSIQAEDQLISPSGYMNDKTRNSRWYSAHIGN